MSQPDLNKFKQQLISVAKPQQKPSVFHSTCKNTPDKFEPKFLLPQPHINSNTHNKPQHKSKIKFSDIIPVTPYQYTIPNITDSFSNKIEHGFKSEGNLNNMVSVSIRSNLAIPGTHNTKVRCIESIIVHMDMEFYIFT